MLLSTFAFSMALRLFAQPAVREIRLMPADSSGAVWPISGVRLTDAQGKDWILSESDHGYGGFSRGTRAKGYVRFTSVVSQLRLVGPGCSGLKMQAFSNGQPITAHTLSGGEGDTQYAEISSSEGFDAVELERRDYKTLVARLVTDANGLPSMPPLRCSLHNHSAFSDGGWIWSWWPWSLQQAMPSTVTKVLQSTFDVIAFTEHAEHMTPFARRNVPYAGEGSHGWNLQGNHHSLGSDDWNLLGEHLKATNTTARALCIRGFEWSADEEPDVYGHISVLGSESLVGHHYQAKGKQSARKMANFVNWLSAQSDSLQGRNRVVAQFNHPNLYNRSPFNSFALPANGRISPFCLCELSTNTFPQPLGPKEEGKTGIANERLYIDALTAGWKLAPVFNLDEHMLHGLSRDQEFTGVYCSKSEASLLDALYARMTFASSASNFRLMLSTETEPMGSYLDADDLPRTPGGNPLLVLTGKGRDSDTPNLTTENIEKVEVIGGFSEHMMIRPIASQTVSNYDRMAGGNSFETTFQINLSKPILKHFLSLGKKDMFFLLRVTHGRSTHKYSYSAPIWVRQPAKWRSTPGE